MIQFSRKVIKEFPIIGVTQKFKTLGKVKTQEKIER